MQISDRGSWSYRAYEMRVNGKGDGQPRVGIELENKRRALVVLDSLCANTDVDVVGLSNSRTTARLYAQL